LCVHMVIMGTWACGRYGGCDERGRE
jgi:hypothetical protein